VQDSREESRGIQKEGTPQSLILEDWNLLRLESLSQSEMSAKDRAK